NVLRTRTTFSASQPNAKECRSAKSERALSRKARALAELLLDAQQLVVLCRPFASARTAGFDLSRVGGDGEISDRRVFSLARPMGDHRGVVSILSGFHGFERLGQRSDLIQLD